MSDHPYATPDLPALGWVSPHSGLLMDVRAALRGARILDRAQDRHRKRLQRSWLYPIEPLGPKGLSNGSYRADLVPDASEPVDNSETGLKTGLRGSILWRPGTIRFRISGYLSPRPARETTRGRIRRLSRGSTSRLLELTRELEARGKRPAYMIGLTYPHNWRAALTDSHDVLEALRAAWQRLEELRELARKCREILRYNRAGWAQFSRVRERLAEQRSVVRALVADARKLAPDGRNVKRHLTAWLKRFDRRFGAADKTLHQTFCAAVRAQQARPGSTIKRIAPTQKRDANWAVETPRYRCTWWLEFQRRGAPHIHIIFFDVNPQIAFESEVRPWAGAAWAAVVAGVRNLDRYADKGLGEHYDQLRELWGRDVAREFFALELSHQNLDIGVWDHMRAGTQVKRMQKDHWGYMAAEASGGRHKGYQKRVPQVYQNVGRWWGYRRYRRSVEQFKNIAFREKVLLHKIIDPLAGAVATLPAACFRFAKRVARFMDAIKRREAYGCITVWGQPAVSAALMSMGIQP